MYEINELGHYFVAGVAPRTWRRLTIPANLENMFVILEPIIQFLVI